MKSTPTQKALAVALGVSQQRISQLKRGGMDCSSVKAAREWIAQESRKADSAPQPQSLNAARLKKILLDCVLIQNRIERESDTSEQMKVSELERGLGFILRMMGYGLQKESENLALRLVGLDEIAMSEQIKLFVIGNYLESAVQMIEKSEIDGRLARVARKIVAENIVKVRQPMQETVSHHA